MPSKFFKKSIEQIFCDNHKIIDIGGGLRILKDRGNRYNPNNEWIAELLPHVNYMIMDPVSDYNPDLVGDIHDLPFKDNDVDAIICLSVLEHVVNPIKAFKEIYRVLKPGGHCLIYVPFLYYYHAEKSYYKDYWRFTDDILVELSKPFSSYELHNVRGALETWIKISPLGRYSVFLYTASFCDKLFNKTNSKQTSGYDLFLTK